MIKASEARRNYINYTQSTISPILEDIEKKIAEESTKQVGMHYDCSEMDTDTVCKIIMVLRENNYEVEYDERYKRLTIIWAY